MGTPLRLPNQVRRLSSIRPEDTVYSGPKAQSGPQRVTLRTLRGKYLRAASRITMVTAYDYPSAVHVRHA